ncbi:M20/M25/M40 family metallo-hydrolase [Dasania marina]|uniref:M20/M25/M40 family metallo-hydrolase n=1 Tax=Dasania marina TaxID=471499 RepID=UPI0030D9FC13|tara:strand:- start:5486 stop:6889 length:1404 start_codon:yes stop_codon:yes gene_type:complete
MGCKRGIYYLVAMLCWWPLLSSAAENVVSSSQNKALSLLRDSIAMRTVEGYGKVPELAHHLQKQFLAAGFDQQDIQILPVADTVALVVRYRARPGATQKPILLSAHMDVVDALPQDWLRDPYTLIEEDGYFFGRGVADNKFAVSVLSATFMRLKAEGYQPARDLILAFSGDEETQMLTTQALAIEHRALIDAEYAIVADGGGGLLSESGEAVSFTIDMAEKTYASFRVTASNPGGHSSLPRKDNAIYDLAQALIKLDAFQFPVMESELTREFFRQTAPLIDGELGKAMSNFVQGRNKEQAIKLLRSKPDYVGTLGTTCVATLLSAGHAENALPQSASATINCRIFPGVGVEATLDTLKKVMANNALQWQVLDSPKESDASPMRKEVFDAVARSIHPYFPDLPIIPHMASGASDALHFRAAGIPCYTLSTIFQKSSDEFAHGLNERVAVHNLPRSMGIWYALIKDISQ